jgi:hypothetical protein
MNIHSSTNAAQRPQYSLQSIDVNTGRPAVGSVMAPQATGEKVTLSSETQKIAPTPKTGVEQYALPSWFTEFSPAFANVSRGADARLEEAKKYTAFHEQLAADGSISLKDAQALKTYMDVMMPANTEYKRVHADYIENQGLYKEYGRIHNQYLQDAMAEQGIVTQADWDAKVKNAPDENQELRLSLMEKMFSNPRAMELMSLLGIQKPAA